MVVAEDIASLVNGELTLAHESDGSFKNKTHAIIRPR